MKKRENMLRIPFIKIIISMVTFSQNWTFLIFSDLSVELIISSFL